ncbi:hypothetical protein [Actinacidiphila yeochonensis]|uniref:hypothetical protein n=1 Tax=Actinacidiphila yeochonensis TaxID=89050 RepID=UPI0005624644|nr:hypothetical protein [Actinacidiphila yeochonensis]
MPLSGYRKTKYTLAATAAALLGTLALSGTAQAATATATVYVNGYESAQALSYGANGAVRVCDTHADGYGVRAYYYRASGSEAILYDSNGSGSCTETTDVQSNPIVEIKACVVASSLLCSPWVPTGR